MPEQSFLSSPLYQEVLGEVKLIMDGAAQRHIDLFGQPWYKKHFKMGDFARTEGEFKALLGQVRLAPAASSINQYSERPIRSFEGLGTVNAEMVTWAHTYKLDAETIRAIALYQKLYPSTADKTKVMNFIRTKLLNARGKVIEGVENRLSYIAATILSNDGVYTFTKENDPGSPFIGQTMNFGWDNSHSYRVDTATDIWNETNAGTVNVLEDLMGIQDAAEVPLKKMLMRREQAMYMLTTAKMKLYVNGSDRASAPITLEDVNTLLAKYDLPEIELVRVETKFEENGGKVQRTVQPWTLGKILFVTDDNFGTFEHQMTDADLGLKSPGIEYSKYNNIEVQSWVQGIKEGTNYTEFQSAAITTTPVVESIKDMYSLDVLHSKN